MSFICPHCGKTADQPVGRDATVCEHCSKSRLLMAEDYEVVEANAEKWAARAHLIPDHVWHRVRTIWNSAKEDGAR